MAAREMGGLSLADALSLCELLANADPARYERAALRWLQRFIDEQLLPLAEVALAASALAELPVYVDGPVWGGALKVASSSRRVMNADLLEDGLEMVLDRVA